MKLSRACARAVLVLGWAGCPLLLLQALLRSTTEVLANVLLGISLLSLTAAFFLLLWQLRCAHCGQGLARLQWSREKTYYCEQCGKPFVFDDEP